MFVNVKLFIEHLSIIHDLKRLKANQFSEVRQHGNPVSKLTIFAIESHFHFKSS